MWHFRLLRLWLCVCVLATIATVSIAYYTYVLTLIQREEAGHQPGSAVQAKSAFNRTPGRATATATATATMATDPTTVAGTTTTTATVATTESTTEAATTTTATVATTTTATVATTESTTVAATTTTATVATTESTTVAATTTTATVATTESITVAATTTTATVATTESTTAATATTMELISDAAVSNSSSAEYHRIPYILHQTWISDRIPATYVPYVKSWISHKPPLSYYYWTDESSLRFVVKHYPSLLATFRGYKAHLSRADAIRYMLLHHYGGVYADMDMMRLKDLTPLLNSSQELCYLSQERYEITRLYWGLKSSVMNAIMLSAPGHKFMEYVVKALPRFAHHSPNVMESTGPFFLQNVYNEYLRSPPCNLSSPMCRCVAADPYDFMPQVDPIRIPLFRSKCLGSKQFQLSIQQEACDMLEKLGWRNDLGSIGGKSYTHHGFLHYGFENQRLKFDAMADIGSLRPDKLTFGRDLH